MSSKADEYQGMTVCVCAGVDIYFMRHKAMLAWDLHWNGKGKPTVYSLSAGNNSYEEKQIRAERLRVVTICSFKSAGWDGLSQQLTFEQGPEGVRLPEFGSAGL